MYIYIYIHNGKNTFFKNIFDAMHLFLYSSHCIDVKVTIWN